jgi:hypothetical protein
MVGNVYNDVMVKCQNACYICGSKKNLELHHIIYRRHKIEADEDNCIILCDECHRGENGVHGRDGFYVDLRLKLELQGIYFARRLSEDKVRLLMGGKLRSVDEYFD